MNEWPAWKRRSTLKAEQLIALESYLLTPWSFAADFCPGVDSMQPDSVSAENEANSLTVFARNVRGLTAGGCPVSIGDKPVQKQIELSSDGSVTFDATIVVNDESSETKFSLLLLTSDSPPKAEEWLPLGQFRWDAQSGLCRKLRPPVRRLAALRNDKDWSEWVKPVASAINELSKQVGPPPQMDNIRLVAFANEICQLQFEWPTLTILSIMRTAQFLFWLRKTGNDDIATSDPPTTSQDALSFQQRSSDELPAQIALSLTKAAPPTSSDSKLKPDADYQLQPDDRGIAVSLLRGLPPGKLELRIAAAMLKKNDLTFIIGTNTHIIKSRAIGQDRRFALPKHNTDYLKGYSFYVTLQSLAAADHTVVELWHSK